MRKLSWTPPVEDEPDEVPETLKRYLKKLRETKGPSSKAPGKNKFVQKPREPFPGLARARIRMSGRSRIAFSMPAGETELPFRIEAILEACRRWPMRLTV